MRVFAFAAALCFATAAHADLVCRCDPAEPKTLESRECSLCAEVERHSSNERVFFLKDINPRKPNRMLVLPKIHGPANHRLSDLPNDVRIEFWNSAVEKARSLWGEQWALSYNGIRVRTQCHTHVHIGKLLPGVEAGEFKVVNSPRDIPVLPDDGGLWIHPVDGKLHVHIGEHITETVLLR